VKATQYASVTWAVHKSASYSEIAASSACVRVCASVLFDECLSDLIVETPPGGGGSFRLGGGGTNINRGKRSASVLFDECLSDLSLSLSLCLSQECLVRES
jgi:hypothetical protein